MTNEEKVALAHRLSELRETSVKAIDSQIDLVFREFIGGVTPFKVRCKCGWTGWNDDIQEALACPQCGKFVLLQ